MGTLTIMLFELLGIFGIAASSIAAAPDEASLRPSGKWVAEFGDAQCLISRQYGTGADGITLLLKPSPLGDLMQLAIVRPGRRSSRDQVAAGIAFDESPLIETKALLYGASEGKQVVSMINLPMEQFDPFRHSKRMRVQLDGVPDRPLLLDQTGEVVGALDTCLESLRDHWTIGPERAGRIRQNATAKANLASLVRPGDFPNVTIPSGQRATTRFALLVDEKGVVADCMVSETSGFPALDAQSCAVVKARAKFKPAVGADGRPVRSMVVSALGWFVP